MLLKRNTEPSVNEQARPKMSRDRQETGRTSPERQGQRLKGALPMVTGAAWKIVKKRWYWLLAVLLLTILLAVFFHLKYAAAAFIIGIMGVFFGLRAESFLGAGLVMTVLTGFFLVLRYGWLSSYTVKIAFIFVGVGTLIGAWRLWTLEETDENHISDEEGTITSSEVE